MFSKLTLAGTFIGFIFLFFGGWCFYDIIAINYFSNHMINMPFEVKVRMEFIAFGVLFQSYVISLLYGKWSLGNYSLKSGFKFGALIGFFVGFGTGLVYYATANLMDLKAFLVDAVWSIFYYGIAGALIGWTHKKLNQEK